MKSMASRVMLDKVLAYENGGQNLDGPAALVADNADHAGNFEADAEWLAELVSGRHQRLGDAVLAAQVAYADSGALPELLSIYHLFGDPALVIR